jgi:hypothetical protein
MTNTANYPATKEQFTANCNALHSLINSKVASSRTNEVANKRTSATNLAIERMRRFYAANPTSAAAPAILSRANEMQAELDAALNRTTPATAIESGQAAILMLIALVAIIICLYFATSAAAKAAGYTDIVAMMDAMTHIFPTP